jgi:hypothetical protein
MEVALMKSWHQAWLLAVFAAATILVGDHAAANPPTYLVLRSPSVPVRHHRSRIAHHTTQAAPRGRAVHLNARSYAYGWFGVAPRSHWSRHHGYYGNFTEWSAR